MRQTFQTHHQCLLKSNLEKIINETVSKLTFILDLRYRLVEKKVVYGNDTNQQYICKNLRQREILLDAWLLKMKNAKRKKNSLTPTLKSRRKNSSCGLALKKHLSPYFIFSKINKSSYPRSPVNVGKHSCSKQPDPIA